MKLIFKSLISNEAVVTGSRKHKWWVALLILLFSLLVSIVPTFVQNISTQGDALFASSSYGLDMAFVDFVDQCDQSDYKISIKDNKFESENWAERDPIYFVANGETDADAAFYWTSGDFESARSLFENVPNTVVIFFKESVLLKLVNPNNSTAIATKLYDRAYKDFDDCDFVAFLRGSNTQSEIDVNRIWGNAKDFINKANNYTRVVGAFGQAGIISGINMLVAFLMGLMVFILTRGKTNVFRIFNFWEGQKIAYWASITPAVLGLIFGFLIPSFAAMSFVLFYGVRVMWLTMKQLRPDGSGYVLPKEDIKTVNVKDTKK